MVAGPVMPRGIRRLDDAVEFDWDGEGHVGRFAARALRLACPCAACVDEMTNRPLLDAAAVPMDVRPVAIDLVGAYGLRVHWSDGHATGIYTFQALRAQCPCSACEAARG
ncbi:MAG TPA: DUF971 domain-containing protein [Gemmatimonadales bacterium]|nr:DUF971 domain-containing protein [Gemmatimonadales bacterium]